MLHPQSVDEVVVEERIVVGSSACCYEDDSRRYQLPEAVAAQTEKEEDCQRHHREDGGQTQLAFGIAEGQPPGFKVQWLLQYGPEQHGQQESQRKEQQTP